MAHVVQTEALVYEGILTPDQAKIIARRSRQVMVSLAINSVLCFGIIAAALGFISLLGDALAVAIVGGFFLGIGATILVKATDVYRMFGIASALIGSGMLVGGAAAEIVSTFSDDTAGLIMLGLGLIGAVITAALHQKGSDRTGFLTGSILLMTTAMHIGGLYLWAGDADLPGAIVPMLHLYVATITLAVGIFIDVRLITALAIVPFAQMLDTGTFYWHAMYAFYSPETTLSILQLSVAMAVCVAVSGILVDRYRRTPISLPLWRSSLPICVSSSGRCGAMLWAATSVGRDTAITIRTGRPTAMQKPHSKTAHGSYQNICIPSCGPLY